MRDGSCQEKYKVIQRITEGVHKEMEGIQGVIEDVHDVMEGVKG